MAILLEINCKMKVYNDAAYEEKHCPRSRTKKSTTRDARRLSIAQNLGRRKARLTIGEATNSGSRIRLKLSDMFLDVEI